MASVKRTRQRLSREERQARGTFTEDSATLMGAAQELLQSGKITTDSFQNFMANLGIGTDNLTSGSTYGFNPITRNRILLEWMHRGSWVAGMAVDVVADDMTREGVDLGLDDPEAAEALEEAATRLNFWPTVNDTIRWSRLYGGCVRVPLLDGQKLDTPLRLDAIGHNQLKGFLVLDRWQVMPSIEDLVSTFGPDYGMPKFYTVTGDAPGLRGQKIHHSRVLRLEGVSVPYWQRVIENLWGISVLERLYDRLVAFDSATQGASQLVYKAWLRTLKVKSLRTVVAQGGDQLKGLVKYVDMMRRFQSIEGMTLIDGEDDYAETGAGSSFTGLAEALVQFGQQLSGALQIPLVRLFGQSPAGLNSTGESDLKMYYDGINQRQERDLRVAITRDYRIMAASEGIPIKEGFRPEFNPLWQLSDDERSQIAQRDTQTANQGRELGIPPDVAMHELQKKSKVTGFWGTLTEEDIQAVAEAEAPPPDEPGPPGAAELPPPAGDERRQLPSTTDAAHTAALGMAYFHKLPVVIESPAGSLRRGRDWEVRMPADYGYIRGNTGADGDQVDCYVGPSHQSGRVFVVNQLQRDGKTFDEHKVLLGYLTPETALEDYKLGHSHAAMVYGGMAELDMSQLKRWLAEGDHSKPLEGA